MTEKNRLARGGGMLETKRLQIALVRAADAAGLCAYYQRNRDFLAPWEPERAEGYYSPELWQIRAAELARNERADRGFHFIIRLKEQDAIAGICNFSNVVRGAFQACHLGYSIDAAHEGRGLMGEALGALIPHVFARYKLHRIMANYMPRNQRSGRLLARLGFEREGLARDYLMIAGRWEDHVLTSKRNPDMA